MIKYCNIETVAALPSAGPDRNLPALQPLTARSIVLSTLLGYHPPALPVSALVRVGGLFGINESTTRAALSRLVAAGDLTAEDSTYRLTERLVRRQRQQDDSVSPRSRPWAGGWEMAVVTTPARPQAERVALRKAMIDLRLAELREGVWLRPDNLVRPADGVVVGQCTFFRCDYPDPGQLTGQLWDLPGWAATARRLHAELGQASGLPEGFMLIAEVVRHLRLDPYLPPELLPTGWPGQPLRARFTAFRDQFAGWLRDYSTR
jgi:phenylacetic acid degradation operon negative regulatory protein